MPAKRTTLPPELMAELAPDQDTILSRTSNQTRWVCPRGHGEYNQSIKKRRSGQGCPTCGKLKFILAGQARRGNWRQHKDFHKIENFVPETSNIKTIIHPPCEVCLTPRAVAIEVWLRGQRRHKACALGWGSFRAHPDFRLIAHLVLPDMVGGSKIAPPCHVCGKPYNVTVASWLSGCRKHRVCYLTRKQLHLHPDFQAIAQYVPTEFTGNTIIKPPCSACGLVYVIGVRDWLDGSRRHVSCANDWGNFKKHPDYWLIAHQVSEKATSATRINIPCEADCGLPYRPTLGEWLRGHRRHFECYSASRSPAARLTQEAPDLLSRLEDLTAQQSYAILWGLLGKSASELKGYRAALAARQKGADLAEAVQAGVEAVQKYSGLDDVVELPDDDLPEGDVTSTAPQPTTTQPVSVDLVAKRIKALESLPDTEGKDARAYQYLVDSFVAKTWQDYCAVESQPTRHNTALPDLIDSFRKGLQSSSKLVQRYTGEWCRQHDAAAALELPRHYHKRQHRPNMVQRLNAVLCQERRAMIDASAPGAGKTLSAILSSMVLKSRLTIIVCPLNVVKTWEDEIQATYGGSRVSGSTLTRQWQPLPETQYLILHYDMFQADDAAEQINTLAANHDSRVGYIVLDEVHRIKNDGTIGQPCSSQQGSVRRAAIEQLVAAFSAAKLKIQTGTPTLTGIAEGVSLLRLVDPKIAEKYDIEPPRNTFDHAVRLHFAMTSLGVRFKPDYGVKLHEPQLREGSGYLVATSRGLRNFDVEGAIMVEVPADVGKRVCEMRKTSWLRVDEELLDYRLDAVKQHLKPQTVVYTHAVGRAHADEDVVDRTAAYICKLGLSVAVYDGRASSKKPSRLGKANLARLGFTATQQPTVRDVALARYLRKEVDVLVCSSTLGEGVNGLHKVGSRVVVLSPPWTDGAYEQLVGRWLRKGQSQDVEVVMTLAWWRGDDGQRHSLDVDRLATIKHRGALADAVLDGALPDRIYSPPKLREAARMHLSGVKKEDNK